MSAILLPSKPGIRAGKPRLIDWGGRLVPILGGPVQNLFRLGTRFSLEFQLPPMPSEPTGRRWAADLIMAKHSGAIMPFIQDQFNVGAPGLPVVDGAGQTGMTLEMRSVTPGYAFRYGQFFSLIHGGKRYLHMVAAQAIVGSDGKVAVPIFPMLRVIPADGAVLEVGQPKIEGSLLGNEVAWDIMTEPMVDLGTIRIDEDA